jgi:Ca2+/Na+ antiporter
VALVSEIFVESVQKAAETFGMSQAFVGFIVVALVGGAAEMTVAFSAARNARPSGGPSADFRHFRSPVRSVVSASQNFSLVLSVAVIVLERSKRNASITGSETVTVRLMAILSSV